MSKSYPTPVRRNGISEYILEAPDVRATTVRIQDLLSRPGTRIGPLRDDFTHRKDRMRAISVDGDEELFFKALRDGNDGAKDAFCDLVCAIVAEEMGYPTPAQRLVELPGGDVGLMSRFLDGKNCHDLAETSPPNDLANTDALQNLYAFELWVYNTDDKAQHLWSCRTSEGKKRFIVDHGHTLYRRLPVSDSEHIETLGKPGNIGNPAGRNEHLYGVESTEDVQEALDEIASYTDVQIETWVGGAVRQFQELENGNQSITAFLGEVDRHRWAAETILKNRRDVIGELAQARLDK